MENGKHANQFFNLMKHSNKKYTLLILAGGIGSRYKGRKQLDSVGPSDECLMEYSIYDSALCGFNKVVLVINKYFSKENINYLKQIAKKAKFKIYFVYQNNTKLVSKKYKNLISQRTKPWGTGYAIAMAEKIIQEPFLVINADDYYNKKSFSIAIDLLKTTTTKKNLFTLITFPLRETLSNDGAVSRGICLTDKKGFLKKIEEHTEIFKTKNIIQSNTKNKLKKLSGETPTSMNFWIFHHEIFYEYKKQFINFLKMNPNPKKEFFLPEVINTLIKNKKIKVRALSTTEKWLGITFPADKEIVKKELLKMSIMGKYPNPLWS